MNQSLPPAFREQMRNILQNAFPAFEGALASTAPVSIRLNPAKTNQSYDISIPWCKQGRYLPTRPVFTLDPTFHGGAYYVQEASSMLLEQAFMQLVDVNQNLNVLDLCAAPGGKSTHIISLLSPESLLVSNEVIRTRASILSENIQKWGTSNVVVTNNDPEDFGRVKGFFDVIVVDAPCSGEGLFRRDADAVTEWSPDNVQLCFKRQRRIISDIWSSLKPGGMLIYSTCTYNRLENEENLHWINEQFDAECLPLKLDINWGVEEVREGSIVGYHCYPHRVKGEGFFLSAVRKTSDGDVFRGRNKNKFFQRLPAKYQDQLNSLIKNPELFQFVPWKEFILLIPTNKLAEIEYLAQNLHLVQTGTTVGEFKHDKLIPDHAFALCTQLNNDAYNVFDLSLEEALQFLRKETWPINETKKGYTLVVYQGVALGWINALGNRFNNMYPANWRIRMAG